MSSGYVYVLSNPSYRDNLYKIGHTTGSVKGREKELSRPTGVPEQFDIVYEKQVSNSFKAEQFVHKALDKYRYNDRREFFLCEIVTIIDSIEKASKKYPNSIQTPRQKLSNFPSPIFPQFDNNRNTFKKPNPSKLPSVVNAILNKSVTFVTLFAGILLIIMGATIILVEAGPHAGAGKNTIAFAYVTFFYGIFLLPKVWKRLFSFLNISSYFFGLLASFGIYFICLIIATIIY